MPFAGTVIISMNPQYSGGSDNLYRFMANIITQITNETLRGLLDKSNIENIKHIRDDLERLKTYYNPDNNLPLYDVLSSERIMNLPEWKQTRASIIQLLDRYINTINTFIAQSGQQAGRRRSSTKRNSKRRNHKKRSTKKGGAYYLGVEAPKVGGLAQIVPVYDPLKPAFSPRMLYDYPSPAYLTEPKLIDTGLKGGKRRSLRKKQRGGVDPAFLLPQDGTGPILNDADLKGNFSPDMMTRSFNCHQPYWGPSCT
jgi:hypothetical protein